LPEGPEEVEEVEAADEADEAERPRARRRVKASPRRVWPWVAGGAAALLLVLGSAGAFWMFRRPSPTGGAPADAGGGAAAAAARAAAPDGTAPFVPPDAVGLVSLRVADVWNSEAVRQMLAQLPPGMADVAGEAEKSTGLKPDEVERVTLVVFDPKDETVWLAVATRGPVDRQKILGKLAPGATEGTHQGKAYHVAGEGKRVALHFADDRTFVVAPAEPALKRCLELAARASASGPLADGVRASTAGADHLVAAVAPSDDMQKALADAPPDVRPYLPLLQARSALLTADLGKVTDLRLSATYADGEKAAAAKEAADKGLEQAREALAQLSAQFKQATPPPGARGRQPRMPPQAQQAQQQAQQMMAQAEETVKSLKPELSGTVLSVRLKTEATGGPGGALMVAGMLAPAMQKIRAAAGTTESLNNLKQIALALHNYHSTYGHFPPAVVYSKDGKRPLYSWRVELLPFLEEQALYSEFHRDEPWDSPHNKKLAARMPKVFSLPGAPALPGKTYYQVFTGPGTAFAGPQGSRIADFTDGTSNTLLVVEAARPATWTEPADLSYSDNQDPRRQVGGRGDKFQAVMADGRALLVPKSISEASLRAAILPADGKPPGPDWP
jgi:hypothetical protein